MTPTKILFGQLLISLSIAFGMVWIATQWTADALNYSVQLGSPWFWLADQPIYRPFELFIWWYRFEAYSPVVFFKGGAIAASGGLLGAAAAVAGSVHRAKTPEDVDTYGSAKWADDEDIRKSGLIDGEGVFLGQVQVAKRSPKKSTDKPAKKKGAMRYLRHDGPEHVLGFAPTRSGKGVGLVVPTLVSWTGSVLVHDIKGENWQLTAGWRSKFSRTLCFDPTRVTSAKFNPLMEIRKGRNEVRDVQNIIDIMIDPQGKGLEKNHWDKTSNDLMVAIILHVLYAEAEKTMWGIAKFMSDPDRSFGEMLALMKSTPHLGDRRHPVIAHGAQQAVNMSPNEFSGVLSTAMTLLGLYRDPIVNEVTSQSDFTIDELVNGDCPMSLYLVVPPSDIARTRPLIRLMLNQILARLTERLDVANPNTHKLLLMLDEFPALGRLDFFETALGFIAGYNIKAFLIAQSLNQIEKAYGPNNAVLDNCHIRVAYATNDDRTAKRISDSLGTSTEQRTQRNFTGHRLGLWLGNMMVSSQETSRALLTQGEVMQLPADQSLVMMAGLPPIRAQKVVYYKHAHFNKRLKPAPGLTDNRRIAPTWTEKVVTASGVGDVSHAEISDLEQAFQPDQRNHSVSAEIRSENGIENLSADRVDRQPMSDIQARYLDSLENDLDREIGGRS